MTSEKYIKKNRTSEDIIYSLTRKDHGSRDWRKFVPTDRKFTYGRYPEWLREEKIDRKENPEPEFFTSGISLTFLTPTGEEETFKYFMFEKKKVSIEDFGRMIRFLEDRYMIDIPKTTYMSKIVNGVKEVDLSTIQQRLRTRARKFN